MTVEVKNLTRGVFIARRVSIAETSLSRMVGLLRHDALAEEEGLWIRPSSGVHTVGMRFPIDVIGLDRDRRVVKLWPSLPPLRVTTVNLRMKTALELAAGTIDRTGIQLGDRFDFNYLPLPRRDF